MSVLPARPHSLPPGGSRGAGRTRAHHDRPRSGRQGSISRPASLPACAPESSSTRASQCQIHSQKRRMLSLKTIKSGDIDCEFGFDSQEWSCSVRGMVHGIVASTPDVCEVRGNQRSTCALYDLYIYMHLHKRTRRAHTHTSSTCLSDVGEGYFRANPLLGVKVKFTVKNAVCCRRRLLHTAF